MTEFNLIKCPQFLDNAISPPAREIGSTLGNIFYTIFYPINYPAEKLRLKQAKNLEKYEQDIEEQISQIPEGNLVEPPLNIVGPALEASKFYIEDEKIRKMFAKLIASSMDIETTDASHPSFIEVVKQISLVEANIIDYLAKNSFLPYAESFFEYHEKDTPIFPIVEPYVKIDNLNVNYLTTASSLKNIHRLGLIKFIDINISGKEIYMENLLNSDVFNNYHEIHRYFKENYLRIQGGELRLKTGNILLTSYGSRFSKVCL